MRERVDTGIEAGASLRASGYLGTAGAFDDAIAPFALAYAEQNALDHQALLDAIRAGRIKALQE